MTEKVDPSCPSPSGLRKMSFLNRYLTFCLFAAMTLGVTLGDLVPGLADSLNKLSVGTLVMKAINVSGIANKPSARKALISGLVSEQKDGIERITRWSLEVGSVSGSRYHCTYWRSDDRAQPRSVLNKSGAEPSKSNHPRCSV